MDGSRPPKPENFRGMRDMLNRPRPSLSPSVFSATAFEDFEDSNERARSESHAMLDVIPIIAGSKDNQYETTGDILFNNLKKFDSNISAPKPDRYYGSKTAQLDPSVRRDLGEYIIPSSRTSLPAAPNFFLEGKSASGKPDVAQRQAMYDGAVGARGMFELQNYRNATPVYDGNAYTITSTYHPGTGTLQVYATHPSQAASGGAEPQYHMTQLDSYGMTGNFRSFRSGVAAYRNAREWTQRQRDLLVSNANAVAQRRSTETRSFSRNESNVVVSSITEGSSNSETSADELALDYDTAAKRRRRTRPHSNSAV